MRAVVQRVRTSSVAVEGEVVGEIGEGLNILLGVGEDDSLKDADWLAEKVVNLRIFPDEEGRMNISLLDWEGEILIISQFTLYGDCRKGRRPSFIKSADPDKGERLYEYFVEKVNKYNLPVHTGIFGAMMDVHIQNWGPVTLVIDTED